MRADSSVISTEYVGSVFFFHTLSIRTVAFPTIRGDFVEDTFYIFVVIFSNFAPARAIASLNLSLINLFILNSPYLILGTSLFPFLDLIIHLIRCKRKYFFYKISKKNKAYHKFTYYCVVIGLMCVITTNP